jgi:quercetin dioxygenase-like cupin family protein
VDYIFKTKALDHEKVKQLLLDQIDLIPNNPVVENQQNIFHTDWNLPRAMHREYFTLFSKTVSNHLAEMVKALQVDKCEISSFWFQRYKQNGSHPWHTHTCCHYANVYFLECPKGYSTKFKHFNKECEEGDIISFPAFLPHMSPPIENNSMKTIISFNTDFIT